MVNFDLVTNVTYISAKNKFEFKNVMTVGKTISSPSKPDQPRFFCIFRLEVMVLQRQPSWWWLWNVRQLYVIVYTGNILGKNNFNKKNYMIIGKNFSSPTKRDQPGISSFIRLEVMAF